MLFCPHISMRHHRVSVLKTKCACRVVSDLMDLQTESTMCVLRFHSVCNICMCVVKIFSLVVHCILGVSRAGQLYRVNTHL